MKRIFSLFVLLMLYAVHGTAQPFNTKGGVSNGFDPSVDRPVAVLGDGAFQLTQQALHQTGAVWNTRQIDLACNFTITAKMYFGVLDSESDYNYPYNLDIGADGIGFVLQTTPNGLGGRGGGLGFAGITPSFITEFDTYQNFLDGLPDPKEDHIAFSKNGSDYHLLEADPANPLKLPNIEDGLYHDVKLEWNATTKVFKVTFDNNPIFSRAIIVDLRADIFSCNRYVYSGFTAATGWSQNEHRVKDIILTQETCVNPPRHLICDPIPLSAILEKVDVKCYNEEDGSATLTVTGGVPPYTYSLSGQESIPMSDPFNGDPEVIANLEPGNYTVVVKDAVGNTVTKMFVINQPASALTATASGQMNVKCNGASTGSVVISASGGTAPYTGTGTKTGLAAGEYTFTVTDDNGCEADVTVVITQPTKLIAAAINKTPACGGSNGTVTITASGGTAPYTGTGLKTGLSTGVKTFTVTDANGCTASVSVTIEGSTSGGLNVPCETFPNQFNTGFTTSLYNKTFVGSAGTWTANSNKNATIVVVKPYYSASSSYALKIVNFKTSSCYGADGSCSAASPKLNLTGACCPNDLKFTFTLWTYEVNYGDSKASLSIDFSSDNGATWNEVWSKTSGQLYSAYGDNGKTNISVPVPSAYQTTSFKYRFRGEMNSYDNNNFYLFIDDICVAAPSSCSPAGSIGDFVWNDVNKNGKQDDGEDGIQGVKVKLTYPGGFTSTVYTDADGGYNFSNLAAGTYTVAFTTPSGFAPSPSNVGSNDNIDSDPVGGTVTVVLAAGQNKSTIDAGFYQLCDQPLLHKETFPYRFNSTFCKNLYNKNFYGYSGKWTANSNSNATVVVTKPYYSPSSSYAIKLVNFSTGSYKPSSKSSATSPKVDLTGACCPDELKFYFTLWSYAVSYRDDKATFYVEFSKDNGATWTSVWSRTSGQLYSAYGCYGKATIAIDVPGYYQNTNFRYRFRAETEAKCYNNFYLFIDDIKIKSPESCTSAAPKSNEGQQPPVVTLLENVANAPAAAELLVKVTSNPTRSTFQMELQGKENIPVTIRITDLNGRIIKTFTEVSSYHTFRFGNELLPGTYVAEVIQGAERKVVKLIKF